MTQNISKRQKSSLLEQVRQHLRLKHYSIRTEKAYLQCIKRFILYHRKRHPVETGVDEIRQYLSHLATSGNVAASTQNVELAALLFLYREVLGKTYPLLMALSGRNNHKECLSFSHVTRLQGEEASRLGGSVATGGEASNQEGWNREEGQLPYVEAQLRHASARRWLRHQNYTGVTGLCRRADTMIYTHVLNRGGQGVKSPLAK